MSDVTFVFVDPMLMQKLKHIGIQKRKSSVSLV